MDLEAMQKYANEGHAYQSFSEVVVFRLFACQNKLVLGLRQACLASVP